MKTLKEMTLILLTLVLMGGAISLASKYGSQDRKFLVHDYSTKQEVWVTEKTIKEQFKTAPTSANCDMMGICNVNGVTMLNPNKWGE